jgi:hypothetical protein
MRIVERVVDRGLAAPSLEPLLPPPDIVIGRRYPGDEIVVRQNGSRRAFEEE